MYIVGSGWYCAENYGFVCEGHKYDPFQRNPKFFNLWYTQVNKYLRPEKIVVVDACSPIPPPPIEDCRIQIIKPLRNWMLWKDSTGPFCGAMNAILTTACYALTNQCDFLYVEQDALIRGHGFVEAIRANMQKGCISYGRETGMVDCQGLRVEHSIQYIPWRFLSEFVHRYTKLSEHMPDRQVPPEVKYDMAYHDVVDYLPFGYGRNRPINWNDRHMYVQHFVDDELQTFLKMEGLRLL